MRPVWSDDQYRLVAYSRDTAATGPLTSTFCIVDELSWTVVTGKLAQVW
jgi:hypothetical protein